MIKLIRKFFDYPRYDNLGKTRQSRYLIVTTGTAFLALLSIVLMLILRNLHSLPETFHTAFFQLIVGMALFMLLPYGLTKRGRIRTAAWLVITVMWVSTTYMAYTSEGVQDAALFTHIILILLAGFLLGYRWSIGITTASVLVFWVLASLEVNGFILPDKAPPYDTAFYVSLITIIATATIVSILAEFSILIEALQKEHTELEQKSAQLEQVNLGLEKQIDERTRALQEQSEQAARAARQLSAIASISTTIARVQNLESLQASITHLISEKMGYYHVGIFLLDERHEYAVLQAANSPGGQKMLARQHKLPIAPNSLVGFAAYHKEARIATETGADVVHFKNPDLPETRSEIALPLLTGEEIIGVLDIQASEPNAFGPGDVETLKVLANQVAVALENARLFSRTQKALEEAQTTYRRFIAEGWQSFLSEQETLGYHHDGLIAQPIRTDEAPPADGNVFNVPLQLQDIPIGEIIIQRTSHIPINQDERQLVQAVAERAALALENTRLLESIQKRAAQEKMIGEIGNKIIRSLDVENILQTALDELGEVLPAADIAIQIRPPDAEEDEK